MKRFFILSLGVLGLAFFAGPESKASVTFRFGLPLPVLACDRYRQYNHYYEHRGDHRLRAPYPRHRHLRHRIGNLEDRGDASVIPLRGMPGEDSSSVPDSPVPDSHSPPEEHP
ncbi:MAG: hypothetical protein WB586_20905 [Chthoniobacterales bacterium]